MTHNGFDYTWNDDHETWVIYPHDDKEDHRTADDFLGALKKKLS